MAEAIIEETIEGIEQELGADSSRRKARSDIMHYFNWVKETQGGFPTTGNDLEAEHANLVHRYLINLKFEEYARETISSKWHWVSRLYSELSGTIGTTIIFDESPIELLKQEKGGRNRYLPDQSEESQKKHQFYVKKDQFEKLCNNCPSPSFRNETILRLAYTTGLRCSELVNLKLENVNFEENLLEDFWVPKTSQNRSLWVPEETMWYVKQYVERGERDAFSYAEESDYLFLSNRDPQMHPTRVDKIVKQAAEKIDLQEELGEKANGDSILKVSAHSLRRGHGMYLLDQGIDIKMISHRLGHQSIQQTEEYLPHSVEESKKKLKDVSFG